MGNTDSQMFAHVIEPNIDIQIVSQTNMDFFTIKNVGEKNIVLEIEYVLLLISVGIIGMSLPVSAYNVYK